MAGLEKIVTDERVFDIADRLMGEGRKVSNRMVWDQVGGGSMTTIAGALRRWRERQQLKAEPPAARTPLPDAVASAMRDAVERLWGAAQEETQKEIDRLTQAMNARVAEAVAERDSALAELQSTVEELQDVQDRAAEVEAELRGAHQAGEALRAELASAVERAGRAEARAVEIERRADGLQAELGRVHGEAQAGVDRDQARREAAEARETAARLQGQLEAMTAQQAELMKTLATIPEGARPGKSRT